MAFRSVDRNSQFYSLSMMGKQVRVDLHPNKTEGGSFRIKNAAEGEALIGRIQEAVDALKASQTLDFDEVAKEKFPTGD